MAAEGAAVPASWSLEIADGLVMGERRGRIKPAESVSFWAGEGFIDYQTKVSGYGCVVLNAPGLVEEVMLKDERLMVEGKLALARTKGLDYRMRRPTSLVQSLFSGEAAMRAYQGTGKALVCWTPYWNQYVANMMSR